METVICTTLFGETNNRYVPYVAPFAQNLDRQTASFEVFFFITPNLKNAIEEAFDGTNIARARKLHIVNIEKPNPNNLDVAAERFAFFQGEKFKHLILFDADDIHPPGSIQALVSTLDQGANISFADHRPLETGLPIYEGLPYLTNRFPAEEEIRPQDILHGNCLLWSNSAWDKKALEFSMHHALAKADHTLAPAGDWITAMPALMQGAKAVFAPTHIDYRQHPNNGNLSGLFVVGEEALKKAACVKIAFAKHVLGLGIQHEIEADLQQQQQRFEKLDFNGGFGAYHRLSQSWLARQKYPMLWEKAVTPDLEF